MNLVTFQNTSIRVVAICIIALSASCGFNPNEQVHSSTQPPDRKTQDGTVWVPVFAGNDEWFYTPDKVAAATKFRELKNGASLRILLDNGKVFQVTRMGGVYSFDGFVDANIAANAVLGGLCLTFAFTTFALLLFDLKQSSLLEEKTAKINAAECKFEHLISTHAARCRRYAKRRSAQRKRHQDRRSRLAADREELEVERKAIEEHATTLAAASRDSKADQQAPTSENWQAVSEVVRGRAFSGQAISGNLIVNHFFDPRRSGLISFRWEIVTKSPNPPALVGYRDGKKFRSESGSYKGEFSDRLLKANKRYQYCFKLAVAGRELPDPLLVEVVTPPFAAWKPEPPQVDTDAERRRKKAEWKSNEYRIAENFIQDAEKLRLKKAAIDEEANLKFGED